MRSRNIVFTGILHILYLLAAYCVLGVYNGVFLKNEITENGILYLFQIVYCIVAAMIVLRKKIYNDILNKKEIKISRIKQVIRAVVLIPVLIVCLIMGFATAFYFNYYGVVNPIPQSQPIQEKLPEKYMIQHENRIAYQSGNECAGYATAFVMRDFGIECDGHEIYQEFSNKTDAGVNLVEIIKYFRKNGFVAKRYYGDLEHLQAQLIKGHPVIVLMYNDAVELECNGQKHFSVVVGYDEKNVYLADSLSFVDQTVFDAEYYNRVLDINLFQQLWDLDNPSMNSQWVSNNYIVIQD